MEKTILKISDFLANLKIEKFIESINKTVFVSLILIVSYLSFSLTANEEQYMLFAKQFMDPDWINSRYLNEFPGTRLLYQIVVGFFLKYFSFESVLVAFRVLLCVFSAIPIAKIYKELSITNTQALLHLPILFLGHQSLFAGSWMLISVESKGFAYVFILFALLHYIKGNFKYMITFLVVATYFHVLVGGYAFIFFMASLFLFEKPKKKLEFYKLSFLYVLVLLPFIYYLKTAVSSKVDFSPSIDWIYSYFRHPHHIGVFRDMVYFYSKHFYGVVLTIIALFFSVYCFRTKNNIKLKRLNRFVFLSIIGVLVALVIAFFDKQGILIKYYPFRVNTFTTFILTLMLTSFIFKMVKDEYSKLFTPFLLVISIWFSLKVFVPNVMSIKTHLLGTKDPSLDKITQFIKKETSKKAVVLSFVDDLSLNRKMERDRFNVYKFIPAEMNAIPEWYERVLFKRALINGSKSVIEIEKKGYKVDYLLSKSPLNPKYLELIKSEKPYYFYKIKEVPVDQSN